LKHITSRIVLLVAAAAILPLLAYGAVSIYSLRRGTQTSVINGNINVAKRAAQEIGLYINTNVKILQTLASDLEDTNLQPWQQDRILKNYVLQFPEFREITLYDATGAQVASSRVGASKVQVPQKGTPFGTDVTMSPIAVDDDLLPTSVVGIRLLNAGQASGWLVGQINLEEMWHMVDLIRIGQQGFALVVASEGQLIAHGDPNEKARVARGDNLKDNQLVQLIHRQGDKEPVSAEFTEGGRQFLGVAAPLSILGWTVIVQQPRSEAFQVADQLQQQLIVVVVFALLFTIAVGYVWGRSFVRPIY
jgi:hypothetical protein